MAWPTISGPYGLKPVNKLGGTPFAGATRHFAIASGYNTNIFNGDVVKLLSDGTIARDAITTQPLDNTTLQIQQLLILELTSVTIQQLYLK